MNFKNYLTESSEELLNENMFKRVRSTWGVLDNTKKSSMKEFALAHPRMAVDIESAFKKAKLGKPVIYRSTEEGKEYVFSVSSKIPSHFQTFGDGFTGYIHGRVSIAAHGQSKGDSTLKLDMVQPNGDYESVSQYGGWSYLTVLPKKVYKRWEVMELVKKKFPKAKLEGSVIYLED